MYWNSKYLIINLLEEATMSLDVKTPSQGTPTNEQQTHTVDILKFAENLMRE